MTTDNEKNTDVEIGVLIDGESNEWLQSLFANEQINVILERDKTDSTIAEGRLVSLSEGVTNDEYSG